MSLPYQRSDQGGKSAATYKGKRHRRRQGLLKGTEFDDTVVRFRSSNKNCGEALPERYGGGTRSSVEKKKSSYLKGKQIGLKQMRVRAARKGAQEPEEFNRVKRQSSGGTTPSGRGLRGRILRRSPSLMKARLGDQEKALFP